MSTELTTITGRYEDPDPNLRKSEYLESELYLTSFSGGTINGPMIQITFGRYPGQDHIQLNKKQVLELITTLTNWL